jgi:hypothetical protein
MRLVVRWGFAVSVSLAAFAVSWWVCQAGVGLDEGKALGVAGAALTVVLAVAAWWAAREQPGGSADAAVRVRQSVRARRDAYTAGRDMKIINHRRPSE